MFKPNLPILIALAALFAMGCVGSLEHPDFDEEESTLSEDDTVAKDDAVDDSTYDPLAGPNGSAAQTPAINDPVDPDMESVEEEEPAGRPEPGTVVEFRIAAGTAPVAWNTRDTAVVVYVGQILRIVNDDTRRHQLHAPSGAPFAHGGRINPGDFEEMEVTKAMALGDEAGFWDHEDGRSAGFWLEARE